MADGAISLPPPNTDVGAMARLFLLEAVSPGMPDYSAAENLPAMRLMRQTIENRLKTPGQYGAAGAQNETDIIELGNQFAGFGGYPTLEAGMSHNLRKSCGGRTTSDGRRRHSTRSSWPIH